MVKSRLSPSLLHFENISFTPMVMTTTLTNANAYELQDTAHRGYSVHNFYTSSRSSNEIRRTVSRNTQRARRDSEIDITRDASNALEIARNPTQIKSARANLIILQVSIINFLTSVSSGMIVVGLPRIAADLHLPEQLYLWPTSVYGLTAGSTLLLAGAVADVVGARSVDLVGCTLLGVFTLACGLSHTGIQLVMFRAFQGVATAIHLPCSVSLVTQFVPSGKSRNIGFACLGLSMPLGFSVGLVLGGILVDTTGWRLGYYVTGGVMLVQTAAGLKIIPPAAKSQNVISKLWNDIDWFGAMIACASLAMFSYVLAILSADSNNIRKPVAIALLVISVALMVAFPFWMRFQEKNGRPALVPNHLWKSLPFSSICALTVLTWGVQNSMELFSSL
jgi:MFS family permease